MTTFTREVTIDFETAGGAQVEAWLKNLRMAPTEIDDLVVNVEVEIGLEDFDDEDIAEELYSRMDFNWLERTYRLLAEGDAAGAMDVLASEFKQLAPPSHARALGDLLTGKRS